MTIHKRYSLQTMRSKIFLKTSRLLFPRLVWRLWTTYMLGNRYKSVSFDKYFSTFVKKAAACEKKNSPRFCAFAFGSTSPTAPYGNVSKISQTKYDLLTEKWWLIYDGLSMKMVTFVIKIACVCVCMLGVCVFVISCLCKHNMLWRAAWRGLMYDM